MEKSLTFAVVAPASGLLGMMGPSAWAAMGMAVEDINGRGGVLGRQLRAHQVDAGLGIDAIIHGIRGGASGEPAAIIGTHPSYLRERLIERLDGRIPYIYTPHYEGGERHAGVYAIGETPERQLQPAITRLMDRLGLRRWYMIGHDYIWPRRATSAIVDSIHTGDGELVGSHYVSFRRSDFRENVAAIAASGAEAVISLLIGQGAVDFHRDFADAGLSRDIVRFSPDVEENLLLAIGPSSARNFYSCSGYFESLDMPSNRTFLARYQARFGRLAPVQNSYSQSLAEGVWFAKTLLEAGAGNPRRLERASEYLAVGGPRGLGRFAERKLRRPTYLAQARETGFDVIETFPTN